MFGLKHVFYRKGCTFSCPQFGIFNLNIFALGNVCMFDGKFSKESSLIFFAQKVVRGNSVQIRLNFPAKSLSIYSKSFSRQLVN